MGDLTITKSELCDTITLKKGVTTAYGAVEIRTGGDLPWLKVMASSFERARWTVLRVTYRPGCAMTQAGRFAMGFDWDWSNTATTRAKIAGYQPNAGSAVYETTSMSVPINRGPSRWFADAAADYVNKGPGKVVWAVDSAAPTADLVLGEVWVDYTVTLSGPKS